MNGIHCWNNKIQYYISSHVIFWFDKNCIVALHSSNQFNTWDCSIISAPEPKAQVHYCDHALSVVRTSSVVVNFSHFRLLLLYQVCVFRAYRKNKMAALASDWLSHFRLLLWNRWTEFNESWQEARSQHPLPSLWGFFGRSDKQNGRPGFWLAETFSTSSLKPLNRIQRNLTGSKISTSSTKFVFFGPIRKTRWQPHLLIGWDIFDFSSRTVLRNPRKLDRKPHLNILYQVVFFGPIGKTIWSPWPLIGWDVINFSSETV